MRLKYLGAAIAIATAALFLLAGCFGETNGTIPNWIGGPPDVTVAPPTGMNGDADALWTVTWIDGTGPFRISMNLGGGTTADVPAGTPAVSPFTQVFTLVNPSTTVNATYTYTVTITDSQGYSGTATGLYTVGPSEAPPQNIESAVYAEPVLTVTVGDPDDAQILTVYVTVPLGFAVDQASKVAAATGPLTASFIWSALDFLAGASGTTTVTVAGSDGIVHSTTDVQIQISPFPPAADTLYAIPLQTRVAVGEPVTVVMLTGVPANPFQFMNGVGITIESDAHCLVNTLNYGAPGGQRGEVDGFWSAMNPPDFLWVEDYIYSFDIGGGRERWGINVTPIGGHDVTTSSGALFNIEFTFSEPGVKTFGFEQFRGVNRTYYSDASATEFFWGDITNSAAPTVTVQPAED